MSELKLKSAFLFTFWVLVNWLICINADCIVRVNEGAPIFTKNFGKKTILLSKIEGDIPLKSGETINAYCSTGINLKTTHNTYIDGGKGIVYVAINCRNDVIFFNESLDKEKSLINDHSQSFVYLNCVRGAERLFESNHSLEGCEDYTSFGIGTVLAENKQMVFAGVCLDFEALTVKYVKYLAHHSKYEFFSEEKKYQSNTHIADLDVPVDSLEILFKAFGKENFDMGLNVKKRENQLLSVHEFDFLNIVQDTLIEDNLKNFDYLLSTVWWRNLRLGSWKIFLNALQKRTESVKYMIYIGTSGKLIIPTTLNCTQNELFKVNGTFEAPEIIWSYLKPIEKNSLDEFVVFGYNTPFYSPDNEKIVCKDICNEIDWLSSDSFNKIRLLPTFGVMHCCRPQDVAKQLDIFPEDRIVPELSATQPPQLSATQLPQLSATQSPAALSSVTSQENTDEP